MLNKFTVEFGDAYGRNFMFGSLKMRIRGRFSIAEMMARPGGGPNVGQAMAQMPTVPGIHLDVNCKTGEYRLWDPLEEPGNARLVDQIAAVMKNASLSQGNEKFKGQDEMSGKMDDDRLKTMVAELIRMYDNGSIRVISGTLPKQEEVEKAKGRILNDLWNSSAHKPKYKDQQEAYVQNLESAERQ